MSLTCLIGLSLLYNTTVGDLQFSLRNNCDLKQEIVNDWMGDISKRFEYSPLIFENPMSTYYENPFPGIEDKLYHPVMGLQIKIKF